MDVCATKVVKSIKRNRSDAKTIVTVSVMALKFVCYFLFNVEKIKINLRSENSD